MKPRIGVLRNLDRVFSAGSNKQGSGIEGINDQVKRENRSAPFTDRA